MPVFQSKKFAESVLIENTGKLWFILIKYELVVILLLINPVLNAFALNTIVEFIFTGVTYDKELIVGSEPFNVYFTTAPEVDSEIEIVKLPVKNPPDCDN